MHRVLHALVMGPLLVAGLLTSSACEDQSIHAKVCVDTDTKLRAVDADCYKESTSERYRWRYYSAHTNIPAVGKKMPMTFGTWNEPDGGLVLIPEEGGRADEEAKK
jgi:hypothetical protein